MRAQAPAYGAPPPPATAADWAQHFERIADAGGALVHGRKVHGAAVGLAVPKSTFALADYMDQIDADVETLDADVRTQRASAPQLGDQSFIGPWTSYLNVDPFVGPSDDCGGGPCNRAGWRAFYRDKRGFFGQLGDEPRELLTTAEDFEREFILYYDRAVSRGLKPSRPRPTLGFEPPPPDPTGPGGIDLQKVGSGLLAVATLFGLGYVLSSVAKLRKEA